MFKSYTIANHKSRKTRSRKSAPLNGFPVCVSIAAPEAMVRGHRPRMPLARQRALSFFSAFSFGGMQSPRGVLARVPSLADSVSPQNPSPRSTAHKLRKVVCMGFPGVGKTTIGVQFVEKQFVDSYNPTISNTFHTVVEHKGVAYDLEIVDSAGQDEHSMWHEQQAIGVDGFIIVYSVVNRKSFAVARVVNDKILDACGTDKVARVLVGNKVDIGSKREVTKEEGQELAAQMSCAFVECSAKQNENIENVFRALLDEMEKVSAPPPWVKPSASASNSDSGCVLLWCANSRFFLFFFCFLNILS